MIWGTTWTRAATLSAAEWRLIARLRRADSWFVAAHHVASGGAPAWLALAEVTAEREAELLRVPELKGRPE